MLKHLVLLLVCLINLNAQAVTVTECVDQNGQRSFQDRCPPGTTKLNERQLTKPAAKPAQSVAAIAEKYPVTLYATANCDPCDLVRNLLQKRTIPFTEKDVTNDGALQNELRERSGILTVPTVLIGDKTLRGYEKQELEATLNTAGYPAEPLAAAAPQPKP
jgi:glutaredoxin